MRSDMYQYSLIFLGIVATVFVGVFFYREVYPEYKIYQQDYVELEKFRSSYTHEPPPAFSYGVKQIVLEKEDKGNPLIDRCTSCHVALQFEHFSPTKIAHDINGQIIVNTKGDPVLVPNENYVWGRLDKAIAELTDEKVIANLKASGDNAQVSRRLDEAEKLKALKTAKVGELTFDVTRVLAMHPLIGKETRPFEFHPIEEYGCTSCHNGNGRGLTTEKAHGPVFDEHYEAEFMGYVPQFTEKDPENDPEFSKVFNSKPGHELLFQTSPIFVGALIQAKCVNCHQSSSKALEGVVDMAGIVTERRQKQISAVESGLQKDKTALITLLTLKQAIDSQGLDKTIEVLKKRSQDYTLPAKDLEQNTSQLAFLQSANASQKNSQETVLAKINTAIGNLVGKPALVDKLNQAMAPSFKEGSAQVQVALDKFLVEHKNDTEATGTLFAKLTAIDFEEAVRKHVQDIDASFEQALSDPKNISTIASDVDLLTYNYHRGQQLYVSQACYACHRIAGLARGGVGPELTRAGNGYPWYIKESIVWPQADLKTSTMPNFRLDHEELEDLVTFLLGQVGETKAVSPTNYKTAIQEWEAGRKLPWEKPISPLQMQDLNYSMTVFATEGCAACHRLEGFQSNVGFKVEKDNSKPSFETLYSEREWFRSIIPEMIVGTALVEAIDKNAAEIDQRIVDGVRTNAILEEIESKFPQSIESLYTPFKFAARAKNAHYAKLADAETDPDKKAKILDELQQWKDRVHRVLMMFVQEYGLGRLIGPRPNWSGVYHTDEWLMEHFRNPTGHVPRSIMPVLPFDDTKFYALTHMLDVLGIRNRDALRQVWENRGFNPQLAFQAHCSQCHGEFLHGNGPVSEWIYPIPKNLRNGDFLRNLTKERAIQSITHGVKGTPMPPWGEVGMDKPMADGIPVLSKSEIQSLVDWLYSSLPGATVIRRTEDVPKWNYMPEDVIKELRDEGNKLEPLKGFDSETEKPKESSDAQSNSKLDLGLLPTGEGFLASLVPMVAQVNDPKESKKVTAEVQKYFEVVPNPIPGTEADAYYIKKEYYTPDNLEQGRLFFELNCAVCHGKDADGSGMRAGTMTEAKPRMLTNLDWIKSRDDLRLLRSIKFGVPGTAMTPWGDLTSSLQRMQLVMYIRTLSEDRNLRSMVSEAIYKAFDHADATVEYARSTEFPALKKIQDEYDATRKEREKLYAQAKTGEPPAKESIALYQKELELLGKLKQKQDLDAILENLKTELKKERDVYQGLGINIILNGDEQQLDQFVKIVNDLDNRFEFKDGKLVYHFEQEKAEDMSQKGSEIVGTLETKLKGLGKEKEIVEGKISSTEKSTKLANLNAEIASLSKLRNRLVSGLEEGIRIRANENKLYEQYKAKLAPEKDDSKAKSANVKDSKANGKTEEKTESGKNNKNINDKDKKE